MVTVEFYTREGCCLCDTALDVVKRVQKDHPFLLRLIDIDTDPALVARFNDEVPVIFIAGRKAFKYRVDEAEMVSKLERSVRGIL